MNYIVPAGLYAIGTPTEISPVIVTANYKMSYDIVRRELLGRNVWLLVLETYGINVWCAAGKGTFGTGELVRRIGATGLANVVKHRELIMPILGAAGVSAPEVARRTGFTPRYAAIRASDLPHFLDDMKTSPPMRELTFTAWERLVLVPVELVEALKGSLYIVPILFLIGAFATGRFIAQDGFVGIAGYLSALLAGVVAGPVLLPLLPGTSFAGKGAQIGGAAALVFLSLFGHGWSWYWMVAAVLMITAVSSFFTLNFTGCTPFTSPSGVKKEIRVALPTMLAMVIIGGILWAIGRF